ncbi:UNVERIFIED_CONTAM: hypothetical protein NCL1_61284 [Trichonephila clavipes]
MDHQNLKSIGQREQKDQP